MKQVTSSSAVLTLFFWLGLTAIIVPCLPKSLVASPAIVPTVQQLELRTGQMIIDESWAIIANTKDPDELFNANYLRDKLAKEFGLSIGIYESSSRRARSTRRIVLGKPATDKHIARITEKKNIAMGDILNAEGYLLHSSSHNNSPDIFVLGNQSAGVFYGIQSLLKHPDGSYQALYVQDSQVKIEEFTAKDWPDKTIRGAIVPLSGNNDSTDNFEWIDIMARFKMNLVVLGRDASELIDLDQIYDYARRRYMEPVPSLRGLAGGGNLVREDPNIAEGIPVVDEQFSFVDDGGVYVAKPVNPVNHTELIENEGFEDPVDQFSDTWFFTNASHWTWDTAVSHSGAASVKMHIPEDPPLQAISGSLRMSDDIPVDGNTTYTLSFWAKTEGTGGDQPPDITTTQLNASRSTTPGTNSRFTIIHLPRKSTDWRQYFQPVYTSEDTRFLRITAFTRARGFGTTWLDDFELRRMDGALVNVIRTESTDLRVTSQDGLTVYAENLDYRIIDGELNFRTVADDVAHLFYPQNQPTKIELLPSGTIDPTSKINISYDFLLMPVTGRFQNPHYSINDQRTYEKHVFPYLEEMIATLDPVFALYTGASEVTGMNRDSRNNGMQNHELLAKDINSVYNHLKGIDPGLKILLWDDMMNPWHNGNKVYHQSERSGGRAGATEPRDLSRPRVTDLIPRSDIIQWVWWYDEDDRNGKIANSPDYFEGRNFQWLASPKDNIENIQAWAATIRGRQECLGMIDWAWSTIEGIEPTASYSWNNANTIK